MKKAIKITRGLITTITVVAMICLIVITISAKASGGEPTVLGYQLKSVLSGSMEPTFQTGSIIAIKPADTGASYKKGDVITFRADDNKIITHRIMKVQKTNGQAIYTTKGDNNEEADQNPVLSQNVIGKYTGFTIPYIGYLLNYANSKIGAALLLIIPGVLLVIYAVASTIGAVKEIEGK
ncbi:Signal peptidase I [Scopulibacillus darangshiensis]|uniref:Signal peptidase I n=1 Tax=Scopulibacillus darangshiensis TaxID=442528 RepID=A0A4R2P5H9_9BACL|nr:signal peptidase I [Scopulibacillus darangshiensis]TCP29221.1 Signal peptidase I [Scopulibacillus darangshiensis]